MVNKQCLLTDGTVRYYDMATSEPYTGDNFKPIGKGIIYSINSVKQTKLNCGINCQNTINCFISTYLKNVSKQRAL